MPEINMADASPRLIHQGVLIKSPPESKSKDLSRWRKRYFKLWSTKTLEYYKTEKSKEFLKKPIDLNKCKSIDGNLKNKKWGNIFCLNTAERKFFLVADSPEIMREWIRQICELCGFALDKESDASKSIDSPLNSPTYVRHATAVNNSDIPARPEASSAPSPQSPLHELPSYNEDLPPIPDSPRMPPHPDLPLSQPSQPMTLPAYGKSIKQNRQNSQDSPCSSYDLVPPPRPADHESQRKCPSTPLESAKLNQTIKDESYVDMQPENNGNEFVAQPASTLQAPGGSGQLGSYDTVPPPIPAGRNQIKPNLIGNYDTVPQPRAALDEYIDCDTSYEPKNGSPPTTTKQRSTPPPVPDPTYTGFDTLPDLKQQMKPNGQYLSSADDIYDTPPRNSQYDDSIYDTPPKTIDSEEQDSIYDTPPIRQRDEAPPKCHQNEEVSVYNQENFNQDIYDQPPSVSSLSEDIYDQPPSVSRLSQDIYDRPPRISYQDTDNSIYDTPPTKDSGVFDDSIYDVPPTEKELQSFDIYDVPPSAADLFNFDSQRPPKVDRTLKHASTSHLDIERTAPPPVDRRTRPALASSVPSFPSSIDRYLNNESTATAATAAAWDSLYDSVPLRSDTENCPEAAYLHGDVKSFSTKTMDFGKQTRNNLQYSHVDFTDNKQQHQMKQQEERRSTDYTTVDQTLTKAMQDARLSHDFSHAQ